MSSNNWNNTALYNEFMGKWSKLVAQQFISWLGTDHTIFRKSWIDIGCGTGALTFEIVKLTNPIRVIGIDPSLNYLPKIKHLPNVSFEVGSSTQIPAMTESFDFVVSGLALNFMSDIDASLKEMLRVLKSNGILALYVWDYSEQMEFLRIFWDTAMEIKSEAKFLDEGGIFPICKKSALLKLFTNNHLKAIDIKEIIIETNFINFDSYWNPFLGGQGPAGSFLLSLNESEKNLLRRKLISKISKANDEPIKLKARSFAIQGIK
ncbi:MAG: class I SAM-dependent methyltransferase [Candidatus Thorarchaeota archaeon]